ncbi:hypothetical protein ACWDBO_43875 [Streptomyces mirabilis]|uniref:hypothetical protein n=1 Tax=Streptomyces mirabilis TaxID=68239 RepID=UPI003326DE22
MSMMPRTGGSRTTTSAVRSTARPSAGRSRPRDPRRCLGLLGQDAAVVDSARTMLFALAHGLLPCLWFQAIRRFTVGMRRPQAPLQITVASIAVNAGHGFRITLIGYCAVGLPAAWLEAHPLGLDTVGIWLGLLTGLATTAVLLPRRYSASLTARTAVAPAPAPA